MNSCNWRSIAFSLLLTAIFMTALPTLGATYFVRQQGNDQADGLTPATAYKTVLAAAQALNHGDTIVIGPGSYFTTALIADRFGNKDARLTVLGDESGQRTGDQPGQVILQALKTSDNALEFSRVSHLTVSGLTFQGAGQGIKLVKCQDAIIERCTFTQQTRGLVAVAVQGLKVESTIFSRCTIGMFIQNSLDTRLAHNTIVASSSTGVVLLACGTGAIRNSLFAANNANYVADIISAPAWTSDYNAINGPTGPWGEVPSAFNISEWFPASGQERHSIYLTPSFRAADKYDLQIAPQVSWGGGLPGMYVGAELSPAVALDRNNRPFRSACAGAYDFPDPVAANEWNKLPVPPLATTAGPRQSAGIYRADGTLVRMLLADVAGVRNLWWDGQDDSGQPVIAGDLQVRSITHDIRLMDDGSLGDNGNPQGAYNCDNADRVLTLSDGSFLVTTVYDEAGYALRRYSASGQPIFAANLTESAFWGIALAENNIIGGVGKGKDIKLIRLAFPGSRIKMSNGLDAYPILTADENAEALGLAVTGSKAYIALDTLNIVRVIDLATGKKNSRLASTANRRYCCRC